MQRGDLLRRDQIDQVGAVVLAAGTRQTLETLERSYEAAKDRLGDELQRFAENTLEYPIWLCTSTIIVATSPTEQYAHHRQQQCYRS